MIAILFETGDWAVVWPWYLRHVATDDFAISFAMIFGKFIFRFTDVPESSFPVGEYFESVDFHQLEILIGASCEVKPDIELYFSL